MPKRKQIFLLFSLFIVSGLVIGMYMGNAYALSLPEPLPEAPVSESPVTPSPRPADLPDVDIHSWELEIFSAEHPVEHEPELTKVEGAPVDVRIAEQLRDMVGDARAAGLKVYISSAYRDEQTQEYLCRRYEEKYGIDDACFRIAAPGTSEHQSGLACDITDKYYADKTGEIENTELFQWLSEHCCEYGFVVRYLEGRKFSGGFIYMPWHFRYVGIEAATYMSENGLSLEEFTALYK